MKKHKEIGRKVKAALKPNRDKPLKEVIQSANALFFRIGVIAYNLFIGFKRLSCPESWVKQTIATFRCKMVQVAGLIVRHAGEIGSKTDDRFRKIGFI